MKHASKFIYMNKLLDINSQHIYSKTIPLFSPLYFTRISHSSSLCAMIHPVYLSLSYTAATFFPGHKQPVSTATSVKLATFFYESISYLMTRGADGHKLMVALCSRNSSSKLSLSVTLRTCA
jgi:hypothetical protein